MNDLQQRLRDLPAVEVLASRVQRANPHTPRALVTAICRRVLQEFRLSILAGELPSSLTPEQQTLNTLNVLSAPSLRSVINATGVVLHTNLGRAPLPCFEPHAGYSNLEYDLARGCRGRRDTHIGALLEALTGAPAVAVNNNAAAVLLVLNEFAPGFEVIVSRGELIEIGDGFRIPEIMQRSGAILREVGTTNRTHVDDYRNAITDRTRLIMRVHPSNFHMQGFTSRPSVAEIASVARERDVSFYEDLGSGCLVDLTASGIYEPLPSASLKAGADLVSFSGDKLLGGPQAGMIAGKPGLVTRLRKNPLFRALRLDKLVIQALEVTLRHLLLERWENIPALAMISQSAENLKSRAEHFGARLGEALEWELVPGTSLVGGGATPDCSLPTSLISLRCQSAATVERRLRQHDPPVIARVEADRVLIDLRTVFPSEETTLAAALVEVLPPIAPPAVP